MANSAHLEILQQGVTTWNQWRVDNPTIQPDLSGLYWDLNSPGLAGINLSNTNLREAWLTKTSLVGGDLSGADLTDAVLIDTLIYNANLQATNLTNANLSQTNLSNSNLSNAIIHNTMLMHCIVTRTNFQGADCQAANFRYSKLLNANLHSANLGQADLKGTSLIEVDVTDANFTGAQVYGLSAWNLIGAPKAMNNLVITPDNEPVVEVDDLQMAQFVYLILRHDRLRQVINSVTERGVLLLGRFGDGGIEVLRAVADQLRALNYLPIIFDFDRPKDRNYTETLKTLVGLSKFVIVDLSGPSVPQELYATVPHFKIPFVPILEKGSRPFSMFVDILEYDWVLKPVVEFETTKALIQSVAKQIVEPAEAKYQKRQALLNELFSKT